MPRPHRCRRVCSEPKHPCFCPEGAAGEPTLQLNIEEYEVIRLVDLMHFTHEQCAAHMEISRTTVTEIYETARTKIADALVNGKRLVISGGHYRVCDGFDAECCKRICEKAAIGSRTPPSAQPDDTDRKGAKTMRIAICYENGEVYQHFGHTEQFKLYDIQDGAIAGTQVISAQGSGHCALADFLKANQVNALICGGIGRGAREALQEADIALYPGVTGSADAAAEALAKNELQFDADTECAHHTHDCHDHGDCHSHNNCHGHFNEPGHGCYGHHHH